MQIWQLTHKRKTISNLMLMACPRMCGEDQPLLVEKYRREGSPPRMRGRPDHSYVMNFDLRFTPAHAGKTKLCRCLPLSVWVHPRACGEDTAVKKLTDQYEGSPPRMRGRRHIYAAFLHFYRFTPAHAGKTLKKWRNHRISHG